ncbi:MAG TPA: PAS domain S-box protein [Thermomicrobiales bacterium]|jgi:PAS domain S-box-containing protein|nr:PAS domain S-box protein [Thermomicrobiales bacterium]
MIHYDQTSRDASGIDELPVWLRAIWEGTSDAIAVSSRDGTVLAANPAYLELYGYNHDEVVGQSFAIIFPEEQRARAVEQHQEVFTGPNSPGIYEAHIRRSDGTERVVESRANFIVEDGVRTALISTIRDITDRVAMEKSLREREEQLRLTLDSAETGVYVWDPQTDRTNADARVRAILGHGAGDEFSLGVALDQYIHPDDRERYAVAVKAMLDPAGMGRLAEEVRWRGADGRERWVRFTGQTIFSDDAASRTVVRVLGSVVDVTDRKRTEEALRDSEERLRLIVENAQGYAIFVTDPEDLITDWFPGAKAVFGWTADEARGQPAAMTFTPEDREADQPAHETREAARNGSSPNVRWHLRKDGSRVFIDGVTTALRDADGTLQGFLKIGQDVTERHRAEQALRESEERFRTLVANLPDYAIFLLDHAGIITEWTAGAQRVKGYRAEEVLGRSVAIFSPPEDIAAGTVEREIRQAIETGRAEREGWRIRKGGERFWANEIITAIHDDAGDLVGFTKISRDLTGRRQAEEALQASESRYRTLIESMDQGFCVVQVLFNAEDRPVDYVILEANPAFERNTGLKDVIGRRVRDLVPGHEEHWFEIYGRVARSDEPERFENEAAALKRWYDVYAYRVDDPEQNRVAVLFQDITLRKQVEHDLEQAKTMAERAVAARDRFLSIGAHELRTPITGLKGTANLLARSIHRGTLTPERLGRYVESLTQATERLETMVTDLFDVARLHASESGQIERRAEPTDLAQLVRDTIDQHWRGLKGSRIALSLEPGPPVLMERDRIRQIVVNLVENGLKYSPGGGQVRVSLTRDDEGVTLQVRDEGIGLPAEALETIFEPFRRATNAEASTIPGMGLGLYICKEIAEAHGGRLWAESAGEGQGTTMKLWLPSGAQTLSLHSGTPAV